MNLGMLDMGINPHALGGRREADGARSDPHLQTISFVIIKNILFYYRCRSFLAEDRSNKAHRFAPPDSTMIVSRVKAFQHPHRRSGQTLGLRECRRNVFRPRICLHRLTFPPSEMTIAP